MLQSVGYEEKKSKEALNEIQKSHKEAQNELQAICDNLKLKSKNKDCFIYGNSVINSQTVYPFSNRIINTGELSPRQMGQTITPSVHHPLFLK